MWNSGVRGRPALAGDDHEYLGRGTWLKAEGRGFANSCGMAPKCDCQACLWDSGAPNEESPSRQSGAELFAFQALRKADTSRGVHCAVDVEIGKAIGCGSHHDRASVVDEGEESDLPGIVQSFAKRGESGDDRTVYHVANPDHPVRDPVPAGEDALDREVLEHRREGDLDRVIDGGIVDRFQIGSGICGNGRVARAVADDKELGQESPLSVMAAMSPEPLTAFSAGLARPTA